MEPSIEELEARAAVSVRTQVQMREIGGKIGELMPIVMAVAGDAVVGPVFARWHGWDADAGTGDMELGVPVAPSAPARSELATGEVGVGDVGAGDVGAGDVMAEELPAGRAAVLWHVGPYDDLIHSWTTMREWVAAQGLVSRGAPWEEYCSDCGVTPAAELRTRIVWPVE